MRFQALRHDHPVDRAVGLEHDLALGKLEIERAALVAGAAHRSIRGIKRLQDFFDDRLGDLVGPAGNRELRLFVMQARRGADQHAVERVRALAAIGADHHAHRQRRAVFVRPQRAQIVGNALRQHRHDAVGKINRIAALDRGAIERRARPHVIGDVGNGDADEMAAAIARVRIGHGVHGVIVVLGVGRIDGDERHLAPVLARVLRRMSRRPRGLRFGDDCAGENVRDAVGVDGDQADGALALDRAEPLDNGAGRQTEPAGTRHLDRDQIAVRCAAGVTAGDGEFAAELLFVDRHQAAAAAREAAEDSKHAVLGAIDQFDDAGARFLVTRPLDAQERTVADAGDFARPGAARAGDADDRRSAVRLFIPFRGPGQELAVGVAAGDVGDHYGGQRPGMMQALTPPFDVAFVGKLAQHALERRPVGILGAECPRNLARTDFAGVLADEGKQLFARGKGGSFHRPLIGRFAGQRS